MKFWGLLAMVAHIENTTKQNHKTNTTNHNVPIQRESLSLILVDHGQAYSSIINPSDYPTKCYSLIGMEHVQHNQNS